MPLRSCSRARTTKATRIRAADPATEALELSCRRTLETWSAPDSEQDQLRRHSCVGAHLTASSLICAAGEGKVLLTLHSRIGRWLQTGGHIEPTDTTLETAAVREAQEESGLDDLSLHPSPLLLSKHEVLCGQARPTYHLDVQYLVLARHPVSPRIGAESWDLQWFAHDQLPEVDHSVLALAQAASARLGW